jgi:hypothetical protein
MRAKRLFAAIVLSLCGLGVSALAQNNEQVVTCEYLKNQLDYSLIEARDDEKAYIDLVFRPGIRERASRYSLNRTRFILKYLKWRNHQFDRILVTHREARTGLGSLEIRVKSKTKDLMFFRKNTTAWNSCIE